MYDSNLVSFLCMATCDCSHAWGNLDDFDRTKLTSLALQMIFFREDVDHDHEMAVLECLTNYMASEYPFVYITECLLYTKFHNDSEASSWFH